MNGESLLILVAGMLSAFNPCGVAMLPSFVVYLMTDVKRGATDGLVAGILMTSGFLLVFIAAGVVSISFATLLGSAIAWIAEAVGLGFVGMGILMILGRQGLSFHIAGPQAQKGKRGALLAYGVAYALGSLGCTLPLFSILVLASFRSEGPVAGFVNFALYAIGMGVVVTAISVASTVSRQAVGRLVRLGARLMGRLSGVITLATGVYLMFYWLPYVHLKP